MVKVKSFLVSLFSEDSTVSMIRVMSFIVCMTGCYIAITRGPEEVAMVSVLLGTAFGGKVAQKVIETNKKDA